MNIFYLNNDVRQCAQMHVDKHCIKMILESAQLLSTAHRVLDGRMFIGITDSGRKVKRWDLPDERDKILYSATHINHPSAIWCRQTNSNYKWLHNLLVELCKEYTYRYGKIHKCESIGLVTVLKKPPVSIPKGSFTEPTPAMPDEYKVPGNSIQSYRNYYIGSKSHMFSWKNRQQPEWIKTHG